MIDKGKSVPVETGPSVDLVPTDGFYEDQWHLNDTWGINVEKVWDDWTGQGVIVADFDDGIQATHPDLDANYSLSLDYNAETGENTAFPIHTSDNHGTAVAGLIAAERNGEGTVGVAFNATLVSIYQDYETLTPNPNVLINAFLHAGDHVDVMNNSWGYQTPYVDNFDDVFAGEGDAIADIVANGRDGLGTVIVFSAGNVGHEGGDGNYHNLNNSRFVISVGGTDINGQPLDYTTPGSNVLVAAPGDGIWSTDRTDEDGYNKFPGNADDDTSPDLDYTDSFGGTSASAPLVAGVVALMLEANPDLGWRDVQEILAYTARRTVDTDFYLYNGARNWNGGGLHFSDYSGAGLVDAHAAVRLAETWERQGTSANELVTTATASGGFLADLGSIGRSFNVSSSIVVERIELDLDIGTHTFSGDLSVSLTSPSGMFGLFVPGNVGGFYTGTWTYGSTQFRGETAGGLWNLSVSDVAPEDFGTLGTFTLRIYGHAASPDDLYVYTDEFSEMTGLQGARANLNDNDGGIDTINAAAVTGAVTINLGTGSATIDGAGLSITGQPIERVFSGDGNDTLTGGNGANFLDGGRGLDRMFGGAGADILDGNRATDTLQGDAGKDMLLGDARTDAVGAVDTLFGGLDGDFVAGGPGADVSYGDGGADWLDGGTGNDAQRGGDGNDVVDGGQDNDLLYGEGNDDALLGATGNDVGYGGDGSDWIDGGADNDRLLGDAGADAILMGDGRDTGYGGTGADLLLGGDGNDHAFGDADNDTIEGGSGDDTLAGGTGDDLLFGGIGTESDVFVFEAYGGQDTIFDFLHDTDVLDFTAGSFPFNNFADYQQAGGLLDPLDPSGFQLVGFDGNTIRVYAAGGVAITADDFIF